MRVHSYVKRKQHSATDFYWEDATINNFSTYKKLMIILEITTLPSQYFLILYSQFKITFEIDNFLVKSEWYLQSPTQYKISTGIFVNKQ